MLKLFRIKNKQKNVYFVEDERETEMDLFPSSLLITPDLLPVSSEARKSDLLVEEILISVRRGKMNVDQVRDAIIDSSYSMDIDELSDALERIMGHITNAGEYIPSIRNIFVGSLRSISQRNPSAGIEFGERWYEIYPDERAGRTLIQLHGNRGNFSRPLELLKTMPRSEWKTEQVKRFRNAEQIMRRGLHINLPSSQKIESVRQHVVYHASQSLPHTSSGYSIRTHELVSALSNHGWKVDVQLRYGYPLDRNDFEGDVVNAEEMIDGIRYYFNPSTETISSSLINYSEVFNFSLLEQYQSQAIRALVERAKKSNCSLIHSASNFVVGNAGAEAAIILGIPSVYEIRGFWHLTQSSKREGYEFSDHYRLSEELEIEVARKSDHVFVITGAIRDILIENSVDPDKITVIPNAFDSNKFNISPRDPELEEELDYRDKVVIGYIGSFVEYEGLDLLLEAVAILKKKIGDIFRVILVGDGEVFDSLRRAAKFLQIESIVKFTGRIPYDEVQRYYSLIDIVSLPRKGVRVCEIVSPLKPFEAMGSGKVLVTSNVAALAEIVQDGKTGLTHEKDNYEDLAAVLERAVTDNTLRSRIGKNAREWVCEHRSWDVISKKVVDVYDKMLM
jgi:glycosyltransferase involved in cell wall biosynthesis